MVLSPSQNIQLRLTTSNAESTDTTVFLLANTTTESLMDISNSLMSMVASTKVKPQILVSMDGVGIRMDMDTAMLAGGRTVNFKVILEFTLTGI